MSELNWNWVYFPYLDAPNKQEESALKAGYVKVVDKSETDKVSAELKQKLESVQASMYCDVVDANRENRKLKRALWLARADRAEARKNYWYVRSIHEGDENLWSIDGSAVKYIGCIKRTNFEWLKIWSEVEIKCRAKAEEYK